MLYCESSKKFAENYGRIAMILPSIFLAHLTLVSFAISQRDSVGCQPPLFCSCSCTAKRNFFLSAKEAFLTTF